MPPIDGTMVFKASVAKVWRRLAVPAACTLDDLSDAILASVKFDRDHLYQFSLRDRFGRDLEFKGGGWGQPFGVFEDHAYSTSDYAVGELPLSVGQSIEYVYDFGDNWQFKLVLESIDPPSAKRPRVIEKAGKSPQQYEWYD